VERVVEAMAIKSGQRVLDFGAGSGVFTFPLARKVGAQGQVTATEVQAGLLDLLDGDARRQGLTWVRPVKGSVVDPAAPLRGQAFDVALLSAVYEFLPDPQAFSRELRASMAPGGRVFIIHPRLVWDFNGFNPPNAAALAALGQETRFKHPVLRRLSPEVLALLQNGEWRTDPSFTERLIADLNRLLDDQSLFMDLKLFHGAAKRDKDAIFRLLHPEQAQLLTAIFGLYPEVFLYSAHRPKASEAQAVRTANWLLLRALLRSSGDDGAGFGRSFLVSPEEITETMEAAGFKAVQRHEFLPYYDFLEFQAVER
jgi:SAM-dependent methyltransferase